MSGDDFKMKKYQSITRHGKRGTQETLEGSSHIVIWEKLDGANSSVEMVDEKFRCYSRNTELDENNTLRGFYNWAHDHFTRLGGSWLRDGLVLYGEWLVRHKLDYGENANKFYLFDVYDKHKEEYVGIDMVRSIAETRGLELAPIFYEGEFQSLEHIQSFVGKSMLGEVGEGVVVKNYGYKDRFGNQVFTKFVSDEFAEKMQTKKHRVKDRVDPLTHFIQSTLTEARVSKMIHKLVDEGKLVEDYAIEDMGTILRGLGSSVYDDIMKEESDELMKIVKQQVGRAVPNVVKQVLANEDTM